MITARERNALKCLNADLPGAWEAKLVPEDCRIYYVDHTTQTSSWLPPRENWDPGNTALPYGWEFAVDKNKKNYFVNHVENYTTRDDPRDDPDYVEPPKPRDVELVRDSQKGFGFVAGSEKPVVVRFVTEGGPSVDKLQPGDQIIKINGQDVKKAPREYVIDLVRSCKQAISLTVCQPYTDNSARKSALLTAAKKDRLKKNPSRVRFAEEVTVNGASVPSNSPEESYVTFMPNVLKVFLENGQTKSFKYDSKTTVRDVVGSLQEKLNIKSVHHFNLVLQNMKSHMPGHMTLLQDHETVSEIASRPGARHFRCLFRVLFVPKDSYDLLKQDPIAFEYFYMQCVNDVIKERFANELKPDIILRLAALHIQQHALSNNMTGKINIKTVEKEFGLERFVPPAVRENMKVKDLRKVLAQSLKMNQNLTAPGQKQLTALQAKLHYMKIVSELKTFGSRVFMVTLLDKKTEAMVLVGPKAGISLVTNIRFYTLSMLADFNEVQGLKVAKEKDNMIKVEMTIKGDEPGTLNLGLLKEDAMNFVGMVNGYYKIFVDPSLSLIQKNAGRQSDDPDIPPYESKHTVIMAPWSYPEDMVSMVIGEDGDIPGSGFQDNERVVDFSMGPPAYAGNKVYIQKLKEDLGIKEGEESTKENTDLKLENKENVEALETEKVPQKIKSPIVEEKAPLKTVIEVRGDSSVRQNRESIRANKRDTGVVKSLENGTDNEPVRPKRKHRSPTPGRKRSSLKLTENDSDDEVEYENIPKKASKGIENGDANSDSDSGVGGETDKQVEPDRDMEQDEESVTSSSDQGCLTDSSFGHVTGDQVTPDTSGSPDPENTSFVGPFDPDQLPPEVQNAVYDPRMFSSHELYIDPDIIDLTLLPPFPLTQEELAEENQKLGPLPKSPVPGSRHNKLLKTASVIVDNPFIQDDKDTAGRPHLQKSASLGYCPDFLDDDIDVFINNMTLQPPPTSTDTEPITEPNLANSDRLINNYDETISEHESDGLVFENKGLSKTIDLGSLALDDHLSSLVIPPPPEESTRLEEIPIVPPVESVKERLKKFEDLSKLSASNNVNKEVQIKSVNKSKEESKLKTFYIGNSDDQVQKEGKTVKQNDSPASVSEKLNELLKSLPSYDAEDEPVGRLRRTSSLRLGRCSSLDFLNTQSEPKNSKHSDLVTGSVRVRPPRIRTKLNMDKKFQPNSETVQNLPNESKLEKIDTDNEIKIQRAHSYDILSTEKDDRSPKGESEPNISEGFASLKAKLQSYRDSLLNRSLRRKEKKQREGIPDFKQTGSDTEEMKEGLTRSSSFSSLLRNSIRRSSKSKEGRASSLTREDGKEGNKDKTVGSMSARDRKIWNTLTTSRANFRLNVAPGQTQDDFYVDMSPDMNQKPKVGPIKALSSVFDKPAKNTKEGTYPAQECIAETAEHKKTISHSDVKVGKRMAPDIPKSSIPLSSKTVNSSQTATSNVSGILGTESSSSKSVLTPKKSKDDSEMQDNTSVPKNVKMSPYATVGKMWRPMSMNTSASADNEDPYRSFNNFDALREMSVDKEDFAKDNPGMMPNGHISLTSLKFVLSTTSKENSDIKDSDKVSVSENSFAVLKEKASASHSNSVKQILETVYTSEDFVQATRDVDRLLTELKQTLESLKSSRIDKKPVQFNMCKEELQSQVRQFVTDAKLLVSNATQTKEKLAVNMNTSMHSLGKIFLHGQATMFMMEAVHQAQHLGSEVMRVANAYKSTLNAAHAAVGKPLSDPHMRYLMRQATNLATLLSTLLKSLKTLEQK